jgi:hypothetical protein
MRFLVGLKLDYFFTQNAIALTDTLEVKGFKLGNLDSLPKGPKLLRVRRYRHIALPS